MVTQAPTIITRPVQLTDIAVLIQLINAYLQFYHVTPLAADQISQLIKDISTNKEKGQFIVAEIAGQVIGFAALYQIYSTFQAKPALILNDLFVLPEFRRLGVGAHLYAACKKICDAGHYAYMEWMTAPDNKAAINFYQVNGAKQTDWLVFKYE